MKSYLFIFLAILVGIISGLTHFEIVIKIAELVSTLFMNFLRFIASPIIFLSIFSTLLGLNGLSEMKNLGRRVLGYTFLTTLLAAFVALILFQSIQPAGAVNIGREGITSLAQPASYMQFFTNIIPSNLIQAFLENNVIGIALMSFLFGLAALRLPLEHRAVLKTFFSSSFQLVLKVTEFLVMVMPFGIWAFVTLLMGELGAHSSEWNSLILYLGVVLGANLVQGLIVLPLFLKSKGISPFTVARGASKALVLAFFSKSSNATLPVTLQCAENKLGIDAKVAHFSLPLCTVVNMNGCAAFILTTVLFISQMNGMSFSIGELLLWVVLATFAAIGNAGVPMGCFFLSSAFLIAIGVPIKLMGLILPFYAFLDMVETALNVWSDLVVTAVIDKELKTPDIYPNKLKSWYLSHAKAPQ
ncbi:MAG: dicarboxylate/amino acid:cation symporter [Simkaniaceae bacterium]|nr:dicarboxylate/amino acid:cation symporter [Simkaniaceae bacterium]